MGRLCVIVRMQYSRSYSLPEICIPDTGVSLNVRVVLAILLSL
jgi:hypothetical protein